MGEKVYPTTKEGLHSYFIMVVAYLLTNFTRLGVSASNMTRLNTLYGDLLTADSYLFLYNLWADEANTRTKTVITSLETFETDLKKHFSVIYNDIPDSVWTDADRTTFGRKTGLPSSKSSTTTSITENCYYSVELISGGRLHLHFKTTNDQSRGSLPEKADGVMLAQRIDKPLPPPTEGDTENYPKYVPLSDADDDTQKEFHSKASFILDLGTANTGNYLQFYACWYNSKHPELAGPWTGPNTLLIP